MHHESEGADLARWLEESGRRRAIIRPDGEPWPAPSAEMPAARTLPSHRYAGLLVLLGLATAQYAFLDVQVRIERIHSNHYFVAEKPAPAHT